MDISVVIPVYRSASTLTRLVDRLVTALDQTGMRYEVVFVDDGSPDDSWETLKRLRDAHPERIVAIQLMRNYGQHNALMCGFRHALGEYVVTMDDDLQNLPEDVPKLVAAIKESGDDVVYGSYSVKQHARWRNAGSALNGLFFRLVFRTSVRLSSFRIMRRQVVESILPYSLNYTYIDGLLAWCTQRVGMIPVSHSARPEGTSGYSVRKLVVLALNLLTNFSLLPLQLASVCGLFMAAIGLVAALYYFIQFWLANITVPGYASIIIAILVMGGIQLLSLGILGEYVGRLHLNVNRKPQYLEREVLESSEPAGHSGSSQGVRPHSAAKEDRHVTQSGSS